MENTKIVNIPNNTQRLIIERLSLKYIEEIFKEFTDEVTQYLRASTPKNIQEEIDRVERSKEKSKKWIEMNFTVSDKQWDFIWCCGVMQLDTVTPEIGLWMKQSARGKGYGKEMVRTLIDRMVRTRDFEYIIYRVHIDNIWSRKIVEHLGWVIQLNDQGEENVFQEEKFDHSSSFPVVEYRIYK